MPNVKPMRLAVISTAPVTSKSPIWRLPSGGTRRGANARIRSPSGTFIAKIAGQPNACVNTPPSSTPEEPPRAPIAPHMPTARLRSAPAAKELATSASDAGESTAPPTPCSVRAVSSRPRELASAHASEESVNSAVPARNTRRRPSRSAQRPPSIRKPANVSVYRFTTHCSPVVEKCKPLRIDGSATFTIETSRITMNCARQTTSSSGVLALTRRARKLVVAFIGRLCDTGYPGSREWFILVEEMPASTLSEHTNDGKRLLREIAHTGERRREELADFLRHRREALRPEDVGLPNGGRRRTPGLRREEVAQLAGVGTTWYTWLEQGRDVRASLDVLEALSRALRLDQAERSHLIMLGRGEEAPPCKSPVERVSPTLRRLIGN